MNKLIIILGGNGNNSNSKETITVDNSLNVNNRDYLSNIVNTLDDYKLYLFITLGVLTVGILTYTYWDNINGFRKLFLPK
jgi:hypothetical protein